MKSTNTLEDDRALEEFRRQLGAHLQYLRKQKRITQEELAARTGLDRVSIGYIEQGNRTPKLRTLLRIAKALGSDLKGLFTPFGD